MSYETISWSKITDKGAADGIRFEKRASTEKINFVVSLFFAII